MKNLVIITLLILVVSDCPAQWIPLPTGGLNNYLTDVHFVSADTGWVVGRGPAILKTVDGGTSWTTQHTPNSEDILSVFFIDAMNGWIGGYEGGIYKTIDGGNTWIPKLSGEINAISQIKFTDPLNGFAVVGKWEDIRYGAIIQTSDGGESWINKVTLFHYAFIDLDFLDEDNGWAVGTNGLLYRTTNGGDSWLGAQFITDHWLHDVHFPDKDTGYAVGGTSYNDIVLKSTDSGSSWTVVRQSFANRLLAGSFFINNQKGWAVGMDGTILMTTNGGNNWLRQETYVSSLFHDVFMVDTTGYAVGELGKIYKYDKNVQVLCLTRPNGGELITAGSSYEILWNGQNVSDVKLDFSIDNGQNWTSIIDSVPSTGTYSWTVPDVQSAQCRIKISDLTNPDIYDTSDGNFTIQSSTKMITILQPNGGEILVIGSNYEINWNSNSVEHVKIEFSNDDGLNWISIVDSVLSTCTYTWTVPDVPSMQCRIKISDLTNPDIYDISDGNFTVQSSTKMITVIKPNGCEILVIGSNYEINWSSNDIEYVKIEYSIDNGTNWSVITNSTQSDGIHLWSVPNIQTILGRVKISDITNSLIFDISDNPFRIDFFDDVNDVSEVLDFGLSQNYPNPFNPTTKIEYSILEYSFVTLKVYDALGNLVSTLVSENKPAGNYFVEFNAASLPSGVYIYKITAGDFVSVRKMLLLK